jgi:hypothetical protein
MPRLLQDAQDSRAKTTTRRAAAAESITVVAEERKSCRRNTVLSHHCDVKRMVKRKGRYHQNGLSRQSNVTLNFHHEVCHRDTTSYWVRMLLPFVISKNHSSFITEPIIPPITGTFSDTIRYLHSLLHRLHNHPIRRPSNTNRNHIFRTR